MLQDTFAALRGAEAPGEDQELTVELVFEQPLSAAQVQARLDEALPDSGGQVASVFGYEADRYHFVDFPAIRERGQEAQVFQFVRELRAAVGAAEANPVLTDSLFGAAAVGAVTTEAGLFTCSTPKDSTLPFGWVHPMIHTIEAWQRTRGQGSVVAVIDTGHSSHQELNGVLTPGGHLNLVEGGTDASDRFSRGLLTHPGHGTLVMSVVASRGDADASGNVPPGQGGVTGAAPEARVLPIRAIKSVINFKQKTLPPAIAHAVSQGADVIAMAQGGATRVASTEKALRDAVAAGVVVVCAAGNCWPSVVFPAAYAPYGLCTAVAALTRDLTPWKRSGRGPSVSFSAPGENVWGAAKNKASDPNNGIKAAQGTTLATSLTSGVAALWVARHGGRAALKAKADAAGTTVQAMWLHCVTKGMTKPPVWGGATNLGAGVLDAERALLTKLPLASTGTEAVGDDKLPATGTESTANILLSHLADNAPDAAAEFDPALADYAAEMIWRSYRAGARARAAEMLGDEAPPVPDAPSEALAGAIADKPALRAALAAY
ncbi:S8 family serine peptidase [Pukyongiella litopenaei]|uniref:S8 family serine peptidase n=1 Tax=Pukyongiella litopenaei TaxID=2605946 RepID=A0A2S0MTW6_9RHOB|nr:S8 family serine peptidase [Pukyongiella litopenaei]AVO39318.1 S8 family serine peptidase [Pukyongiella litopenaei]